SYRVSLRTLEIGVRVALGASAGDVLHLTMAQALRLTAAGLVLGSGAGLAAARALTATLMGAIPFDAATFATATGFLAATALLAAYIPARRALAIDPARAGARCTALKVERPTRAPGSSRSRWPTLEPP